jgi:hypothetical protein
VCRVTPAQALELDRIRDRTWQIIPSNAKSGAVASPPSCTRLLPRASRSPPPPAAAGEGVEAGVQWLSDKLKDSPSSA